MQLECCKKYWNKINIPFVFFCLFVLFCFVLFRCVLLCFVVLCFCFVLFCFSVLFWFIFLHVFLNVLLLFILTQNNCQQQFTGHQNVEHAKKKCSLSPIFLSNHTTWKLMFRPNFPNRTLFFSFFFLNFNILKDIV